MRRAVTLFAVLVLSLALPPAAQAAQAVPQLPADVRPTRYRLDLSPDLDAGTFSGVVDITIPLTKPRQEIILHAKELELSQVAITAVGGALRTQPKVSRDDEHGVLTLSCPQVLPAGEYILHLVFNGKLNEQPVGLYRSGFTDDAGQKHTVAVAMMEPIDARRMFPCFDEPALKAIFQITARAKPGLAAISNAPIARTSLDERAGRSVVEFEETLPMSTYLVALCVGEFEATDAVVVDGVPVRVWAVKGKSQLGSYAQNLAARLLTYYQDYFAIPYPWKKLDLIAVPEASFRGMEDAGAILFSEDALLVDPGRSSVAARRFVSGIVAHEISHMWFGDLVTMQWWDDLWLNESLASWMQVRATAVVLPQWEPWRDYARMRAAALDSDQLRTTHPVHVEVSDPSEAEELFDAIAYLKGGSILRMLEGHLGEDVLREAIRQYLKAHAFGNATSEDLWKSMDAASRQPIGAMMRAWIYEPGYPVVTLERSQQGKASAAQRPFCISGPPANPDAVWQIPLRIRAVVAEAGVAQPAPMLDLLTHRQDSLQMASPPAGDHRALLLANAGATGYYRVCHPPDELRALMPLIGTSLDPAERLDLISSQWAQTGAGEADIKDYVEVLSACRDETDATVWAVRSGAISYLNHFVADDARASFERFVRNQLGSIDEKLGWSSTSSETDETKQLRGDVLRVLGTLGQDPAVIARARSLFASYLRGESNVAPDLLDAISQIVAQNGDADDLAVGRRARLYHAQSPHLYHLAFGGVYHPGRGGAGSLPQGIPF